MYFLLLQKTALNNHDTTPQKTMEFGTTWATHSIGHQVDGRQKKAYFNIESTTVSGS